MKTVAIIAEYNPFHNGHAHQLKALQQPLCEDKSSNCEDVVRLIIQSGAFVQRGTPALLDSFSRAEMAIYGGADIVVELPTLFATGSAEIFATGGVRLAQGLGADYLAFGAEPFTNPNQPMDALLLKLAQYTTTAAYEQAVRSYLAQKVFYGTALTKALIDAYPEASALFDKPNALLGLEYCKAIVRYAPTLKPITIKRNSDYNTTDLQPLYPSATAIRALLAQTLNTDDAYGFPNSLIFTTDYSSHPFKKPQAAHTYMPDSAASTMTQLLSAIPQAIHPQFIDMLTKGTWASEQRFFDFVLLESRLTSKSDLEELADFGEGLASLWQRSAIEPTWPDLVKKVKSKRYSYARLQRMAAYLLLHIKAEIRQNAHFTGPTYARLLAFNNKGRHWLQTTKKKRTIPIINKWASFAKHPEKFVDNTYVPLTATSLAIDERAASIQRLCFINPNYRNGDNYLLYSPRYIK